MVYFAEVVIGYTAAAPFRRSRPIVMIKIGSTADIQQRRAQLRAEYGEVVVVLETLGGPKEERRFQKRFAHLRIDGGKLGPQGGTSPELFYPTEELRNFIKLANGVLTGT